MEEPSTFLVAVCAFTLCIGCLVGYWIGVRRSKRLRKELQQAYNEQSLDMLEVKSQHRKLGAFLGDAERKHRLLQMTLAKLKSSNQAVAALQQLQQETERKHFIAMSRLNMAAEESKQLAKRAEERANDATYRLGLLEKALPQLQTISAPEPKSYGQGEQVTVSVVDQHPPAAKQQQANVVSNRDLHKLVSMQPSNEQLVERPDNTVSFKPNVPTTEQKSATADEAEQNLHNNDVVKRLP